ncbi:CHAP domain-containing protein [Streptacidiphilus sp. PB12-B1b]|uniref:CHAP domain-containing protein n=1 Tax=Streptacidiphilus sp. PB12-B1b TaxID=2705012 RepID=UPI0015F7C1AD|nr:CHAP domain-containing protein [Streptacidiphilus sp. PB12-B1b]QMU77954.1 CHAP domain-containing protein [Streptacidiphilus sp. PB12-B1b]
MKLTTSARRWYGAGAALAASGVLAFTGPAADTPGAGAATGTGGAAAALAVANLGRGAGTCALPPTRNSLGGSQFETSCAGGYTGGPEYWCADFVQWVWQHSGLSTDGLSPEAATFISYGEANGTQHTGTGYQPKPGDAVEFGSTEDSGRIDHVAIVTAVNPDGSVVTANGDWDGPSVNDVSMATYAVRSKVVAITVPAAQRSVGSEPTTVDTADGYYIAGYTTPVSAAKGAAPDAGPDAGPDAVPDLGCGGGAPLSAPSLSCPDPS